MRYIRRLQEKRNVLCLLLVSTLSEHAISLQHHVCLLYMCFIFSLLQLPAENLHYHQVVFLKGNLMVVGWLLEERKEFVIPFPSQRHSLSESSFATSSRKPAQLCRSRMLCQTSYIWYVLMHKTRVICKYYWLKVLPKKGGELWRYGGEWGSTVGISMGRLLAEDALWSDY